MHENSLLQSPVGDVERAFPRTGDIRKRVVKLFGEKGIVYREHVRGHLLEQKGPGHGSTEVGLWCVPPHEDQLGIKLFLQGEA